jgi:flagellar motor switch protein FliG
MTVMMNTSDNLRKAAVFLRSVDAETAATLLAQLSTEEAAMLREAVRQLGPLDPDEQADVAAEFRRERPFAHEPTSRGVELAISSDDDSRTYDVAASSQTAERGVTNNRRFESLENASPGTLASYLAGEHAQTIAVVLSHLPPARAAAVLAELPANAQTAAMDRLANLGDTDSELITVLESELAAWVRKRTSEGDGRARRRDTMSSILAAADAKSRSVIVANLRNHPGQQCESRQPSRPRVSSTSRESTNDEYRVVRSMAKRHQVNAQLRSLMPESPGAATASAPMPAHSRFAANQEPVRPALPKIAFDQLVHLDSRMLARLLAVADANVLALALAGSSDNLVERFCDQMPKRIAKDFRRELRRMGPTRLSDVEDAQRAIAEIVAQQMAERRNSSTSSTTKVSAA